MTSQEFTNSLSSEQSAALNVLLVEQRDAINAMRDEASSQLTEILAAKDAEILAATNKLVHFDEIKAAFLDPTKDTLAVVAAELGKSELSDRDRKKQELAARIAELQAEYDSLPADK